MDKDNNLNRAINGQTEWEESAILRRAYWKIVNGIVIPGTVNGPHQKITAKVWGELRREYVNDPRFRGNSQASPEDRAQRTTLALTNGNAKGIPIELTWKKFIEALVILRVSTLTVTVMVERGNYGAKAMASATCRPTDEHLKMLNEPARVYREAVSVSLGRFFANPDNTANTEMEHILSKILWKLFAEFKIDEATWNRLSKQYVRRQGSGKDVDRRRNDKRNNLQTTIRATDRITWKRFLEAIKAIDGRTMECTFCVQFDKIPTVEYTEVIDLSKLILWSPNDEPE